MPEFLTTSGIQGQGYLRLQDDPPQHTPTAVHGHLYHLASFIKSVNQLSKKTRNDDRPVAQRVRQLLVASDIENTVRNIYDNFDKRVERNQYLDPDTQFTLASLASDLTRLDSLFHTLLDHSQQATSSDESQRAELLKLAEAQELLNKVVAEAQPLISRKKGNRSEEFWLWLIKCFLLILPIANWLIGIPLLLSYGVSTTKVIATTVLVTLVCLIIFAVLQCGCKERESSRYELS